MWPMKRRTREAQLKLPPSLRPVIRILFSLGVPRYERSSAADFTPVTVYPWLTRLSRPRDDSPTELKWGGQLPAHQTITSW